jgi:hypothetical protein
LELTGLGQFKSASGTYAGNGADDRAITGVGFQPDLVIIKGDGGIGQEAVFKT